VATEPERDPVEWAQHSALVAISVARTVLDLLEAAVADRERIERLATTGRSAAETWLTDAVRVASTVATGFGFEPGTPPPKPSATTAPPTAPAAEAKPVASKTAPKARAAANKGRPKLAQKKAAQKKAAQKKAAQKKAAQKKGAKKKAAPKRKTSSSPPKKRGNQGPSGLR
jgi:phosphate:Na+ symporter